MNLSQLSKLNTYILKIRRIFHSTELKKKYINKVIKIILNLLFSLFLISIYIFTWKQTHHICSTKKMNCFIASMLHCFLPSLHRARKCAVKFHYLFYFFNFFNKGDRRTDRPRNDQKRGWCESRIGHLHS